MKGMENEEIIGKGETKQIEYDLWRWFCSLFQKIEITIEKIKNDKKKRRNSIWSNIVFWCKTSFFVLFFSYILRGEYR